MKGSLPGSSRKRDDRELGRRGRGDETREEESRGGERRLKDRNGDERCVLVNEHGVVAPTEL